MLPTTTMSVLGTSDSTAILPTATGSSATVSSATVTSSSTPVAASSKNSSHTGAIVGGVVGGVAGISLLGLAVFMLLRRRKPNIEEYRYPRSAKSGNREKIDLAAGGIPTPQPTPVPTYSVQAPLRLYVRHVILTWSFCMADTSVLSFLNVRTLTIHPRSRLQLLPCHLSLQMQHTGLVHK